MDLALVGLTLGAQPVSAWDLLLPDYEIRGSDFRGFGAGISCFNVLRSGFKNQKSRIMVQGSGFRVHGSRFRVQGPGSRVQGAGFMVRVSGFTVQGSGSKSKIRSGEIQFKCLGFEIQELGPRGAARGSACGPPDLGFKGHGLGLTVCSLGFRGGAGGQRLRN